MLFDEKPIVYFIEDPLYSIWGVHLSCSFQDFLIVFGFYLFDCDLSRWGSLCSFPVWIFLSFLKVLTNILHQSWEVFSHYFFKIFFLPFFSSPSETSVMFMLVCLMMSHWSSRLSTFSLVLFTFSQTENLCGSIFKLSLLSSACSNLLSFSSGFILVIYLSDPEFLCTF